MAGAAQRPADRWSAIVFALVLAGSVLALALPLGRALLPTLSGIRAFDEIARNKPAGEEALRKAAAGRERAIAIADWSQFRFELAALYFTLGTVAASPELADAYYGRAVATAEDSLALRPYDSATWMRAAVARQRLARQATRRSADLVAMSAAIQPNEAVNAPVRLALILDNWWAFTDPQRKAVRGQAAAAFKAYPVEVSLLTLNLRYLALLRGMMSDSPATLMVFEKHVGWVKYDETQRQAAKAKAEKEAAGKAVGK